MNLLFTGGSGYIGSHSALEFLKNTSNNIYILDNLSTGFKENYLYLSHRFGENRVKFIQMDLNDISSLENLFKNISFDCILHFGASLVVSESIIKPLLYYTNNTINTTLLVSLCIKYKIKKFIFSSTAAVYGEPKKELIPINEQALLNPINPYGNSKMMSEKVLLDVSKAYDFNYVALRYFNVAGANIDNDNNNGLGQRSKNATHLIKIACECACNKREKMSIFGIDYPTADGTCIRDYIHINDLANAHLHAYNYINESNQSNIFNVGYAKGYSVKEVISMVKKVSQNDFCTEVSSRRDGDPAELIADNKKILSLTEWKPIYNDLELIVKTAFDWENNL